MQEKQQAVLGALTYFDMFDFPLTKEEVFHFAWKSKNVDQKVLDSLLEHGKIEYRWNYYFLPGRGEIIDIRRSKDWVLNEKMKQARRAMKLVSWVPYLRAVFLCNQFTVSTRDASDVDLLVVTEKKRVWIVRFFCIVVLGITKMRIQKGNRKSKICLSFFVTEDHLDFSKLRFQEEDIYFLHWVALLVPIYDPDSIHDVIMEENRPWLKEYLPNILESKMVNAKWVVKQGRIAKGIQRFFETAWQGGYGDMVQKQLKDIQMKKIQAKGLEINDSLHKIVVDDTMLKFHENDRREKYYQKWSEVIQQE